MSNRISTYRISYSWWYNRQRNFTTTERSISHKIWI